MKAQLAIIYTANQHIIQKEKIKIPSTIKIDYDQIELIKCPIENDTHVAFEQMKSDDCASHYIGLGISKNVVIMNFASNKHRGGGYKKGAIAQEEDLCRVIPQLYPSLCGIKYPFGDDSVLITPNVNIMRNNRNYKLFHKFKYHNVSIVSAAAPNLRFEEFDEKRIIRTLQNIYISTKKILPDTDTLILGAWGCGAYYNDPSVISKIMNKINLDYGGLYRMIIFTVPPGLNANEFSMNIDRF